MPAIKTKRQDILRPPEILEVTERAAQQGHDWLACLIALCNIFGKRISEIISLKTDQIRCDENFLYVRFHVGKKRESNRAVPVFYVKKKTLKHPLMPYIIEYLKRMLKTSKEGYLFPFSRQEQSGVYRVPYIRRRDGAKIIGEYPYKIPGGFISRQLALYYLKKVAPDWWWHLGRESLATRMAEDGASEEELMHWFDWSSVQMAHVYVKRGTKLTEKWSERTW